MENEFNRWLEYAEWRGQTVQALKDITSELKELKTEITNIRKDLKIVSDNEKKRDIKTAEIAGASAAIMVVLGWVISTLI